MKPWFFKWELAMLVSVWMLLHQHRLRLKELPKHLRFAHVALVALFATLGVGGLRSAVKFCFGNASFHSTFREPNLLSLSPELMCWLAGAYAVAGPVFFLTVMFVGEFNSKARKLFLWLVIPCTVFYPVIMGNLTETSEFLRSSAFGSQGVLLLFSALAVYGFVFYRLPSMSATFNPQRSRKTAEVLANNP